MPMIRMEQHVAMPLGNLHRSMLRHWKHHQSGVVIRVSIRYLEGSMRRNPLVHESCTVVAASQDTRTYWHRQVFAVQVADADAEAVVVHKCPAVRYKEHKRSLCRELRPHALAGNDNLAVAIHLVVNHTLQPSAVLVGIVAV